MVEHRGIQTATFEEFLVFVLRYRIMQCTKYVLGFTLKMGNYSLIDHFFVVDVPDTNVVLGIQWLYALGKVTIDW